MPTDAVQPAAACWLDQGDEEGGEHGEEVWEEEEEGRVSANQGWCSRSWRSSRWLRSTYRKKDG